MEEGVDPGDIGVIAPYRRQVLKLRERLAQKGWRQHIDVGTTEEFQGQEKKVIIVSTVRSSNMFQWTLSTSSAFSSILKDSTLG